MSDLLNSRALTDEVLEALEELRWRREQKKPADGTGRSSVEGLRKRLKPIREGLQEAQRKYLADVPAYANMRVFRSPFWQMNPIGAVLKDYVWNVAAPHWSKTDGRFQMTFSPQGQVYGEYVAIKVTESQKAFHIQQLSKWFRGASFCHDVREALAALPFGFEMECTCGDGTPISEEVHNISGAQWRALQVSGLDTSQYFLVARYHKRSDLRDLTVDELGRLLVAELAELSGIYPILQGQAEGPAAPTRLSVPNKVRRARSQTMPAVRTQFTPEFAGQRKEYRVSEPVESKQRHGWVVNALREELQRRGLHVANDKGRDLYVPISDGGVEVLFEVKTTASSGNLYTGIGQLMLNGAAESMEPKRVLVLPALPTPQTRAAIERIGIDVLTFHGDEEHPVFGDIDEVLG
jgi:hypothetical protein